MKQVNNELKVFFAEKGYLILRGFFTKDDLLPVRNDIEKVFSIASGVNCIGCFSEELSVLESQMFNLFRNDFELFVNSGKQVQHSLSLMRLATNTKLESLILELGLDYPNLSVRPTIFFNSKHLDNRGCYWKLEAHQDWRSSQGSLDSVTVWLPYVDCDAKLGALQVVPCSHRRGLLPSNKVDYYSKTDTSTYLDSDFIDVELLAGDIIVFNSLLLHRSGTNLTNKIRWSSQFRFNNLNDSHFLQRKLPNGYNYKPSADLLDDKYPTELDMANYQKKLKEDSL
jgi:hypothetical protein